MSTYLCYDCGTYKPINVIHAVLLENVNLFHFIPVMLILNVN